MKNNNVIIAELQLTESQARNLIDFYEMKFIDLIRQDEEIDNLDYIGEMIDIYRKIKKALENYNSEYHA